MKHLFLTFLLVFLCFVLVSFETNYIKPNVSSKYSMILHLDNPDSLKFNEVVERIVNDKRFQSKYANESEREMVFGLFDIVSDTTGSIDLNKKVEILVLMAFFQKHYFEAYGSVVSVGFEKMNDTIRNLHYIFTPFDLFSDSLAVTKSDTLFTDNLNPKNKMLFASIDSLVQLQQKPSDLIFNYKRVLRKYINEQEFYSRYRIYFGNVPRGQI